MHHDGKWFQYDGLTVHPKPTDGHLDVWLGGRAPSELRRCGRLGDGWLASFFTPADCAAGRPVIEAAAEREGRVIDPEHFGAMVTYSHDEIPDALRTRLAALRGDIDAADLVPVGLPALRDRLGEYVERRIHRSSCSCRSGSRTTGTSSSSRVADAVLDLQT